jgi:hypothetical protein
LRRTVGVPAILQLDDRITLRNYSIFGQPTRRTPTAAFHAKIKCGIERAAINPSLSARNDLQQFE